MRRVLVASSDDHAVAWVRSALDGLDVGVVETRLEEFEVLAEAEDLDLMIIDAGSRPETAVATVERLAGHGVESCVLFIVEPTALSTLRLPVAMRSDFVVRGAQAAEVQARARGLLWPGQEVTPNEVLRVGDLTVNLATYQVTIAGKPIEFAYLEYALFAFLFTHPNRVYSRDVLLRRVWGSDYFGGARTVDVHVRRIRAKLGPEAARRLETVRNVGYLWRQE